VGIVEPWAVAIAAVENAVENGLHLHLKTQVDAVCIQDGQVSGVNTNQGSFPLDAVVNAAGLYGGAVAQMAGIGEPRIHPRRGDYILLDKQAAFVVNSVLFPAPMMNSKGILVLPTIEGNLLLGPTAVDLPTLDERVTEVSGAGLAKVLNGAQHIVPGIDISHTIKTFAGARPEPESGEFVVGRTHVDGFYQAAGMRSPGLTGAPAIAEHLAQQISSDLGLAENESFNPVRRADPRFAVLSLEERCDLIRNEPSYGRLVCRCNEVTEGEIVTAIRKGARTLDGIKFRTRAGFGPCQGGFCTARILAIMSRELGIPYEQITVRGREDAVVVGRIRP
jgi:glycerol-3-phosphate dehydrogenase